jgi:glutaredoxin
MMKPIHEILVFVEPECVSCERVLNTVKVIKLNFEVDQLVVINRAADPEYCRRLGVIIFPATFINGQLAFYGEFSAEEAQRFAQKV